MRLCTVRNGARLLTGADVSGEIRILGDGAEPTPGLIGSLMAGEQPAIGEVVEGEPVLGPPLLPGKIIAAGLNYREHADESKANSPERPLLFAKLTSSVTGPTDAIEIDATLTERVDWEVELGVVIGARMRNVPAEKALDHVFGYTVANDVSARDVQQSDGQWTRAKSFDTFCPLGPALVTADELGDPGNLRLTTTVNGEVMQDDSTRNMIFSVPSLLAYCSRSFPLEPGDLVITGTPSGCGEFMDPPRHLSPGDVVEVSIDGIGSLRNPVTAATAA